MEEMISPQLKNFLRFGSENPIAFWEKAAEDAKEDIFWKKKWDEVFDWEEEIYKWYRGGITNISYNCIEQKIKKGKGDKVAIIYESGETGEERSLTYIQLQNEVIKYAKALRGWE